MSHTNNNKKRKNIFISIPIGRSVKYFLDTELYQLLKDEFRICIFSPFSKDKLFQNRYGGAFVTFYEHLGIRPLFWSRIIDKTYMKYRLFHSDFRLKDKSISRLNLKIKKIIFKKAYIPSYIIYNFLQHVSDWNSFTKLTKWIFYQRYYEKLCYSEEPDLIISTIPSKSKEDYCLQYCAQRYNIPLLFFPDSWDNFTNSGEFPFKPTRIFSWGLEMNHHAEEYFSFRAPIIYNAGIIRFEMSKERILKRNQFREIMKIPKDYKIILFPTNQSHLVGAEERILDELFTDIKNGVFGKAILIIRPNNIYSSANKLYIAKYSANPLVRINIPEDELVYRESEVSWDSVISSVDVILTGCSMIILEAFHWDIPVVNYIYDYGILNNFGFSFLNYYEREVMKKIFELDSTLVAYNRNELNQAINAYLKNSELHRTNRKRVMDFWDFVPSKGTSRCKLAFQEIMNILKI